MQRVRQWASRPHSLIDEIMIGGLVTVVAFLIRYYLEGKLPPGFPYLTFFPAVILTGFFATTRAGVVVAVLCGLASWYFFLAPVNDWRLSGPSWLALAFYIVIVATDLGLIHIMRVALRKLEAERETSMRLAQQNKTMFHELQHRVSNNLQVIASLLKMQQRTLPEGPARQGLETASARLKVIASIQRQLHNPKRQNADIGQVLKAVLPEVITSSDASDRVALHLDLEPLNVSADQATPVALIAVELISNALEHALVDGKLLNIRVTTGTSDGQGFIRIEDDGKGLPPDFQPEKSRSLGLRVAHQFTEQLEGTLVFQSEHGTRTDLTFHLSEAD